MTTYGSFTPIISALLGMLFMISAQAIPVSSEPYFFRAAIMNPDGNTADRLQIGTTVNPAEGTCAVAKQGATTLVLQNSGYKVDELDAGKPYNPAQLGSWAITAFNESDTDTDVTHDLSGVQALPVVSNVSLSGSLLTPTLTWVLPVTTVPYTQIRVRIVNFAGGALVYTSNSLPASATTYTFPGGVLQPDRDYVVRIMLEEVRGSDLYNRSDRRVYHTTYSTPLTISPPDAYYFRRTVRQAGAADRDEIVGGGSVTPSAGTTVTARSLVDSSVSLNLNFTGCGVFPNEFTVTVPFASVPVDIATGGFTLTAKNGLAQDQVTSHDIVGVQPLAFVENVSITGDPLVPTISWTLPGATAPFTAIGVRVIEFGANFCITSSFASPALPATTTTYTLPDGVLKPNSARQAIWIRLTDVRDGVAVNRSEVRTPYSTATVTTNLDVDGNGKATALEDGLLIIRYLFGFRGATLIGGAVAADCTRCTAAAIEAYLAPCEGCLIYDVDGNGKVTALEDGLLIIRYLFGFRGATLIGGAVAADCTRCSATAIESYLASLMP